MAGTATGGLSRVTIVPPKRRGVDLAIPTDVPLAHLLPTLLRYAGDDLADSGATQGGWVLSRLGGQQLNSAQTAGQLDIRDGEVLYFTPRSSAAPELVYDDVADAVGIAAQERSGRWTIASTRRAAVVMASSALVAGAGALLFIGPPQMVGGAIGLAIALALVVTATILARVNRDRRAAVLFALVALVYAGIGGLLLLAGDTAVTHLGAPHVLVAATAVVVFSVVLTISTGGATPLLIGATAAGAVLGAGAAASLFFGTRPAGSAAVVAAVGLAWVPMLPMLAARLARVPIPAVPTGPDDLKADEETLDGRMLRSRADRADGLLSALVGSTAAILLGCEVVLSLSGGLPAQLFCGVLALVLLLRARPFAGRAPRAAVLTAGTLGFGLLAVAVFFSSTSAIRLVVVLGGLVAFAVISLVYGLGIAGKRIAPIWGRALDIVEILLIVAAVPLAIWVSGLYGWVRGLHA